MNETTFTQLLELLQDSAWQAVADGQALPMIDDQHLETGPADTPNVISQAPETGRPTNTLKQQVLSDAATFLSNYYLTHPLMLAGFNQQVAQLFEAHGVAAFAAPVGKLPSYTLFVAGGEVIAEAPESPRHKYGVHCELDENLLETQCEAYVYT